MLFFEPKSQISEPNPKIIVVDLLQLCIVAFREVFSVKSQTKI